MKKTIFTFAAIFGLFISIGAAPGDLDAGFYAGRVTTGVSSGSSPTDSAYAAAVQTDGKTVVVGNFTTNVFRVFVIRYNTDGTLDATFDGDGIVTLDAMPITELRAVKILPDGKIVAAGMTSSAEAVLVRLNPDGALDSTFNGSGVVYSSGFFTDVIRAMAISADGKITVAGGDKFEVMRFNADGSVDTTFNGNGYAVYSFPASSCPAFALALQADGKAVVAGWARDAQFASDFGVVRFNTDGSLDTSFDTDGVATTNFSAGQNDYASAIVIQPDGKIVVGGKTSLNGTPPFFVMALARYNADGSLDSTFDGDGKQTTAIGNQVDDEINALAVLPDGKILAGGTNGFAAFGGSEIRNKFALVRYQSNGALDATFNGTGKVTTALIGESLTGDAGPGGATALIVQPDGKYVLTGFVYAHTRRSVALARYNPTGALDGGFGNRVLTSTGRQFDRANAMLIQPDGKIVLGGTGLFFFPPSDNFILTRYNPDGLLDAGFSFDGLQATSFSFLATDNLNSMVFQHVEDNCCSVSFDRILAVGSSAPSGGKADFALAAYYTDGNADGTIGSVGNQSGVRRTSIGAGDDVAYAAAVYSNTQMIAAGSTDTGGTLDFAVVRYQWFGALDTTFNMTGIAVTPVGAGDDVAYAAAVQADGKIVLAGKSNNGANDDFALVRYNADGSLDTSFDSDGKVTTAIGAGNDVVYSMKIQADGKIVVAGVSHNGANDDFALARYNSTGTLDTSFDGDGIATTAVGGGNDVAYSLAIQTNGKIVAAGSSHNGANLDFAVVRYNADGSLDTTFDPSLTENNFKAKDFALAGDGKVTIPVGSGDDVARAVALSSDGKITIAGYANNGGGGDDFALLRLAGGGLAPTAANVSISGRVVNSNGQGISRATVALTDASGNTRTVSTGSFGYYQFTEVPAGRIYTVSVSHKRYAFSPDNQVLNVSDNLSDVDFSTAD